MEEGNHELKYAGFFTRLLATLVDIVIVSFIINALGSVIPLNAFVILGVWGIYVSVMLSRWHATLGGKLFGIKVLRANDFEALSFKWALIRFVISMVPFLLYSYLRGLQHMMEIPPSPTMSQLPQLIFMLLPMVMFFTKKRQMIHDMIAKSIVVDVNIKEEKTHSNKTIYVGRKILRGIGTLASLVVFGYLLFYVSVLYTLSKSSQSNYDNSFHIKYQTNDYNDSKIIFYNKELEKYSKKFIEAEAMYDIFEADVKKDLALGCMQYFIRRKNKESWIEEGSNFRKNARNKYTITEEKIKKAKRNSNYMDKHFYTFDLNIVNHIEDDITETWSDKNESICEQKLSINNMYKIFVKKYTWEFPSSVCYDERGKKWFELFEQKQPKFSKEAQLEKLKREEEDRIYVEKMQKEETEKKERELREKEDEAIANAKKRGNIGELKMLQVKKIIGDKAKIPYMGFSKKTGILKIEIYGALCSDFIFPPKIQCKSL